MKMDDLPHGWMVKEYNGSIYYHNIFTGITTRCYPEQTKDIN